VAAIEAVNLIRQPEFLAQVARTGAILREVLEGWKEKYPLVGDVRGIGAMMLIELVKDRHSKEPAVNETMATVRGSYQRGVVSIRAGLYSNCIRFLPPLGIPEDQLREALGAMEASLAKVQAEGA
jgi:4-aminobutyrate aminotransferase/(S)-3-amino-2-methylpropionate transaminase